MGRSKGWVWAIGVIALLAVLGVFDLQPLSWIYTTGCGESSSTIITLAGQSITLENKEGIIGGSYHPKTLLSGRCAENTDITLTTTFGQDGAFFIEANGGGKAELSATLNSISIRELAAINIFHTSAFTSGARSGGSISAFLRDEIGQEVQLASTTQNSGDLKIIVSSDKSQVTSNFLNQPITFTNTAGLGRTWTLLLRFGVGADNGQGASIMGQINAIELISPLGEGTITTPTGGEVTSPTSEEERVEETALPTTPVELVTEGLGISTIALLIIVAIVAVAMIRRRK